MRVCAIAVAAFQVVCLVVCAVCGISVEHFVTVVTDGIHDFVARFLPLGPVRVISSDFDMYFGHVFPYS